MTFMIEFGHVGMEDSLCGHVGMEEGLENPIMVFRC